MAYRRIDPKIIEAVLHEAKANPYAMQVWEKVSRETGAVHYDTVRTIMKKADFKLFSGKSELMKRLNNNPSFAKKRDASSSQTFKKLNSDPQFAAKRDASSKKTLKRLNADPEFIKKRSATLNDPEVKARRVASNRKTLERLNPDPDFQKERRGGMQRFHASKKHKNPAANLA